MRKGLATNAKDPHSGKQLSAVQNVSRRRMRGGFTHIALICDDVSIQPRLPQILLGNEHVFAVKALAALEDKLAPNIVLWRRKSGWVQKSTMPAVLDLILAALGDIVKERQVILLMDTAGVHICPLFLSRACRRGVMVHYVPAKLTWLLQHLDTHAFARYKNFIRDGYRKHIMTSESGTCDTPTMIELVAGACRYVLQKVKWASAFDANGYGKQQGYLRRGILAALQWSDTPNVAAELPSFQGFEAIFPKRTDIPLRPLLQIYMKPERELTARPAPPTRVRAEPEAEVVEGNVWHGRLRSSSHRELEVPSATASISRPTSTAGAGSSSSQPWRPLPAEALPKTAMPKPIYPVGRPLNFARVQSRQLPK